MGTLNKVFDDLLAISNGDVATFTRATNEFVREVTQESRMPRSTAPGVAAPAATPAVVPQAPDPK